MFTIKMYLKFRASTPAVFHFSRFFFSTEFKQYQSQQISARYGRFNYNTPEYMEKSFYDQQMLQPSARILPCWY